MKNRNLKKVTQRHHKAGLSTNNKKVYDINNHSGILEFNLSFKESKNVASLSQTDKEFTEK